MFSDLWITVNLLITQYFILFPIGSLCVFLIFAALRMWNCRVAWFLSLSAPGAIVLPILILELLANHAEVVLFIVGTFFFMLLYPGYWIFPIVFAVQFRNLLKRKWDVMTRASYIWAAILLGLYFWTGFMVKISMSL